MNIIFNNIKISNFLSIGSADIDLENKGFVLVEGINNNISDNAKSNGSGKSSIFEAIIWAVTGDTIRGTKDVRNKLTDDGACVELYFTIDKDSYQISRFKDHSIYGNNLKFYKNGQDISGKGIRDTEKILEEYLPDFNSQLLGSVIILGQGLPQRFTNNTPSGRKEILEKLSKSDFMIEDIKNKLSNRKNELSSELRTLQDNELKLNTEITSLERSNLDIQSKLDNINAQDIDKLKNEKFDLESKIEIFRDSIQKIVEDINLNNDCINNRKFILQNRLSELKEEYDIQTSELKAEIIKEESSISFIKQNINSVVSEINKLKTVRTTCPTCGRPFDDVHIPDTSELEQKQNKLQEDLDKANMNLNTKKSLVDTYTQDYLKSKSLQEDLYSKEIRELTEKVNNSNYDKMKEERSLQEFNSSLSFIANQITVIETQKDTLLSSLEKNNLQITNIKQDLEKVRTDKDEIDKRLEVVQKMLTTAQREFRTYLLEDVVKYIDTKVKFYSRKLFKTDLTEFKNDGNQIWIGYAGKQYENLSGGEKQKIDILIQFALRDMLMQLLKFSSNLLVLDEVFDNLDQSGCEELINLIIEELKDVDSVYIITHHADISIPYDDKLVITKNENGISEVA